MGELVRVQNVTRDFHVSGARLRALDGVSFDVKEGETLGIVGESGCGKSTLARLIVGVDRPTQGEIRLGGVSVQASDGASRRRLARFCQMIFQDPYSSLNPRLRVEDIVAEPLVIHQVGSGRDRAAEVRRLLERVGLPRDAGRRFPHEFSGGQRQRIGIARALALKPRVLVADEPVSALDVSIQAQVLNLLADLRDELGLTLLLVSHDLQVIQWGPRADVFERPAHPYTQALLNSAPRLYPEDRLPDEVLLSGDVPSALNPPSGCPFHPRCFQREDRCAEESPPTQTLGDSWVTACVKPSSI